MPKKDTVLWFGAGSPIGNRIVAELQATGNYEVFGTYHDYKPTAPIHRIVKCDLFDLDQIDDIFSIAPDARIIGISAFPWITADPGDWVAALLAERFLRGHMRIFHNVLKSPVKNIRVVNILGQCVRNGLPAAPQYSAAFAAMNNYGKSINGHAKYGKAGKVNVLSLLLAAVRTPAFEAYPPETIEAYEKKMYQVLDMGSIARRVAFEIQEPVMPTELVIDGSLLI